jgi:hypothetical protein
MQTKAGGSARIEVKEIEEVRELEERDEHGKS